MGGGREGGGRRRGEEEGGGGGEEGRAGGGKGIRMYHGAFPWGELHFVTAQLRYTTEVYSCRYTEAPSFAGGVGGESDGTGVEGVDGLRAVRGEGRGEAGTIAGAVKLDAEARRRDKTSWRSSDAYQRKCLLQLQQEDELPASSSSGSNRIAKETAEQHREAPLKPKLRSSRRIMSCPKLSFLASKSMEGGPGKDLAQSSWPESPGGGTGTPPAPRHGQFSGLSPAGRRNVVARRQPRAPSTGRSSDDGGHQSANRGSLSTGGMMLLDGGQHKGAAASEAAPLPHWQRSSHKGDTVSELSGICGRSDFDVQQSPNNCPSAPSSSRQPNFFSQNFLGDRGPLESPDPGDRPRTLWKPSGQPDPGDRPEGSAPPSAARYLRDTYHGVDTPPTPPQIRKPHWDVLVRPRPSPLDNISRDMGCAALPSNNAPTGNATPTSSHHGRSPITEGARRTFCSTRSLTQPAAHPTRKRPSVLPEVDLTEFGGGERPRSKESVGSVGSTSVWSRTGSKGSTSSTNTMVPSSTRTGSKGSTSLGSTSTSLPRPGSKGSTFSGGVASTTTGGGESSGAGSGDFGTWSGVSTSVVDDFSHAKLIDRDHRLREKTLAGAPPVLGDFLSGDTPVGRAVAGAVASLRSAVSLAKKETSSGPIRKCSKLFERRCSGSLVIHCDVSSLAASGQTAGPAVDSRRGSPVSDARNSPLSRQSSRQSSKTASGLPEVRVVRRKEIFPPVDHQRDAAGPKNPQEKNRKTDPHEVGKQPSHEREGQDRPHENTGFVAADAAGDEPLRQRTTQLTPLGIRSLVDGGLQGDGSFPGVVYDGGGAAQDDDRHANSSRLHARSSTWCSNECSNDDGWPHPPTGSRRGGVAARTFPRPFSSPRTSTRAPTVNASATQTGVNSTTFFLTDQKPGRCDVVRRTLPGRIDVSRWVTLMPLHKTEEEADVLTGGLGVCHDDLLKTIKQLAQCRGRPEGRWTGGPGSPPSEGGMTVEEMDDGYVSGGGADGRPVDDGPVVSGGAQLPPKPPGPWLVVQGGSRWAGAELGKKLSQAGLMTMSTDQRPEDALAEFEEIVLGTT